MLVRYTSLLTFLALWALPLTAQNAGSITGQITDSSGASIPGAKVSVLKAGAMVKSGETDIQGSFSIPNVQAGSYTVRVSHFGFSNLETKLQLAAGQKATLNTQLQVQSEVQSVTVQGESVGAVSVDASQNANALILKQTEIDALPDDPDDLANDLQQLAGPSAGPNGGQIYIDGFTGGRLPPKESIREIRINQNPYSSEYDKLGYGRIEILTKPGFDKWHGQGFFNDSDSVFNARNPLLSTSPDFSTRFFGGNVGGPLNKKTSFYFDIENRMIDDSAVISTQILDPNLNIVPYSAAVPTPQRRLDFSPRLDYQLNDTNTLVLKYNFLRNTQDESGVGNFALANQGVNTESYEHSLQVTDTAVLSAKMINETRFRWLRDSENNVANTPGTMINVAGAFTTGGFSTPNTTTNETNLELQNYTSITQGTHAFKFGLRIRSYQYSQDSPANFLGMYTFAGGVAPLLDASNNPVLDANGNYVLGTETSLEQYRRTLLFTQQGLPAAMIRQLGGGASQYSVSTGTPNASIAQLDAGLFFQDDWRIKPNLTVNFGLRYEIQNQLSDFSNWAPRFGFAWSPDSKGNKTGKTVIRGGSGIFYDRLPFQYPLNGEIYNGQTIQRYIVTAPDTYPNVPLPSDLSLASQTINQIDPHFHAEYNLQSSIGVERALPHNSKLSVNYLNTRGVHMYRTVNINAPDAALNGDRPFGDAAGNIFNYESTGFYRQNQLIVTGNTQIIPAISLFTYYTLNYAKSDTDGIGTFPSNQYNFDGEYSRAAFDYRHRAFVGGSITARYGVRLSPFIFFHSSGPYNITSGYDYLDQSVFTERPAFTTLACGSANVVCTPYGNLTSLPGTNDQVIPRNYGNGPSQFVFNLRVSKTWGFGESTHGAFTGQGGGGGFGGGPGGGGGPRGGGGGGRGGPGGMFGDASTGRKYNLTLTAEARNLFNNVNYANPVGAITSPLFGTSNQLAMGGPGGSNAENRRLTFGLRFAF